MSARKVGGIWFLRIGSLRISFCRAGRHTRGPVQYRRPAFPETY